MKWLVDVLAHHAHFDLEHGPSRELLAEAIIEAIPGALVADTIKISTAAVLRTRSIADPGDSLAREVGNNAAQCVLVILLVADESPISEGSSKLARVAQAIAALPGALPEPEWQEKVWAEIARLAEAGTDPK